MDILVRNRYLYRNVGGAKTTMFQHITDHPFISNYVSTSGLPVWAIGTGNSGTFYDFDGDGDLDVICGMHEVPGVIKFYENTGNWVFVESDKDVFSASKLYSFHASPQVHDLNGDGMPEVSVANHILTGFAGSDDLKFIELLDASTCEARSSCSNKGVCTEQTNGNFQCVCGEDALGAKTSGGSSCKSCPSGKIETKYISGSAITRSNPLPCTPCAGGRYSTIIGNLDPQKNMCKNYTS